MAITIRQSGEAGLFGQLGRLAGEAAQSRTEQEFAERAASEARQMQQQKEIMLMQQEFQRERDKLALAIDLEAEKRGRLWDLEKMELASRADFSRSERERNKALDQLTAAKDAIDKAEFLSPEQKSQEKLKLEVQTLTGIKTDFDSKSLFNLGGTSGGVPTGTSPTSVATTSGGTAAPTDQQARLIQSGQMVPADATRAGTVKEIAGVNPSAPYTQVVEEEVPRAKVAQLKAVGFEVAADAGGDTVIVRKVFPPNAGAKEVQQTAQHWLVSGLKGWWEQEGEEYYMPKIEAVADFITKHLTKGESQAGTTPEAMKVTSETPVQREQIAAATPVQQQGTFAPPFGGMYAAPEKSPMTLAGEAIRGVIGTLRRKAGKKKEEIVARKYEQQDAMQAAVIEGQVKSVEKEATQIESTNLSINRATLKSLRDRIAGMESYHFTASQRQRLQAVLDQIDKLESTRKLRGTVGLRRVKPEERAEVTRKAGRLGIYKD